MKKIALLLVLCSFVALLLHAADGDPISIIDGPDAGATGDPSQNHSPVFSDPGDSNEVSTSSGTEPGDSSSDTLVHPNSHVSSTQPKAINDVPVVDAPASTAVVDGSNDSPSVAAPSSATLAASTSQNSTASSIMQTTEDNVVTQYTQNLMHYVDIATIDMTAADTVKMHSIISDLQEHISMYPHDQVVITQTIHDFVQKQINAADSVEEVDIFLKNVNSFMDQFTDMTTMASNLSTAVLNGVNAVKKMGALRRMQLSKKHNNQYGH